MKKLLVTLVFLSILLTGCSLFIIEEDTDEYRLLLNEYESYVEGDISNYRGLKSFINQVTLETSTASVVLEVKTFDSIGLLVETNYGSGVIVIDGSSYYQILTTYELVHQENNQTTSYKAIDYLGNEYRATLRFESVEHNLAILRIIKDPSHSLLALELASIEPLVGEPVMLIGYQGRVINAMTLGMIESYTEASETSLRFMTSRITSDRFGNGGVIINLKHQIAGIQFNSEDNLIYSIALETIQDFLKQYLE